MRTVGLPELHWHPECDDPAGRRRDDPAAVPSGAISPGRRVEVVVDRTPEVSQIGRIVRQVELKRDSDQQTKTVYVVNSAYTPNGLAVEWTPTVADTGQWTLTVTAMINGEEQVKSHTLAVFAGSPTLALDADTTRVTAGTAVGFTARAVPDTLNGQQVVLSDLRWSESGLALGGTPAACSTAPAANPCTIEVFASGVMRVTASVNGTERTATASVSVDSVPCPTGDSLVDDPSVRLMLRTAWDSSRTDQSQIANYRERSLHQYDSAGVKVLRLHPVASDDTPCRSRAQEEQPLPGARRQGAHSHPFAVGDSLPWQECGYDPPPPGKYYVNGPGLGGPSLPDWRRAASESAVHWVIDRDSIYRATPTPLDSTDFPTDWKSNVKSWPRRQPSGCSIP